MPKIKLDLFLLNWVPAQSEKVRLNPDLLLDEGDRGVVGGDHENGPLRRAHEEPEVGLVSLQGNPAGLGPGLG